MLALAVAAAIAWIAPACASYPPATARKHERVDAQQQPRRHDPADLEVVFQPAIGVFGVAQFRQRADRWDVAALRNVRPGKAAAWAMAYRGGAATKLERAVDQVKRASPIAQACPPRTGRDGVTWLVTVPGTSRSWELSDPPSGGPECHLLARQLHDLMLVADLDCEGRHCLRPEERRTGKWSCAESAAGAQCRAGDRSIGQNR